MEQPAEEFIKAVGCKTKRPGRLACDFRQSPWLTEISEEALSSPEYKTVDIVAKVVTKNHENQLIIKQGQQLLKEVRLCHWRRT